MKNKFISMLSSYKKRGGLHIFASTLISQVTQMVLLIFIVRFLDQKSYGEISFMQSYLAFFIPFSGLGLNYALLRFGSTEKDIKYKNEVFQFCLKNGILFSIVIYIGICLLTAMLDFNVITNKKYIYIFALLIFTDYLKEISQSYLRIQKKNQAFAYSNIAYSVLIFLISLVCTYLFKIYGFIIARIIVPGIVFILIMKKQKFKYSSEMENQRNLKEYSNYGLFVGLGAVASQMMYQIDQFFLGIMIVDATIIAEYKVASIIPFAILFIPSVFMTTDFVMIAEQYNNKNFLINYRKRMMKLLFAISSIGAIISWLFSKQILVLLYGNNYADSYKLMNILMVGIIASFTLRAPNGNILAAVGKSKWNAILAYSTVGFNIVFNFFFIKYYGHYGAAIATSIVMWLTGILSYLLFNKYVKELN